MIAGIDPGRWKIGVAFCEGENLLFSAIVPTADEDALIKAFVQNQWKGLSQWGKEGSIEKIKGHTAERIFIGCGTSSKEFVKVFPLKYIKADEYGTTLEARKIYWKLHPPRGAMKLIPLSLRTPPRNVDDLAAYVIAQNGLKMSSGK